jgi:hypothetical protein
LKLPAHGRKGDEEVRKFDTTPKPAFLLAMRNQRWSVQGALAELVDNGFGPGRGNARRVDIIHDTTNRLITVLDDGQGMESIGRLFQLGNTIGRCPGDIGLYGSGGTMAILWLASVVDVWSLKSGLVSHDSVDWLEQINRDTYPEISEEWETATPANTPAPLLSLGHGTMIRIKLSRERTTHSKQSTARPIQDLCARFANRKEACLGDCHEGQGARRNFSRRSSYHAGRSGSAHQFRSDA